MLIIVTTGPKSNRKSEIRKLINTGADIIRLNSFHIPDYDFERIIKDVRLINQDTQIMQDLSGQKIRVSSKLNFTMKLYIGEEVTFCTEDSYDKDIKNLQYGGKKIIPLNITKTFNINNPKTITIKDNTMLFDIISFEENKIITKSKTGGIIRAGKGCNIKGLKRKNEMTETDKKEIELGIKNKVDIISQSYVESMDDIEKVKKYIKDTLKSEYIPSIWAKIESKRGIDNCLDIIKSCDGILIGRGDMIAETSILKVPFYQNYIISMAKKYNKKIIVGTNVLNSMKSNMVPTLPEIEAIYNSINKGIDGFMLAGETSVSVNPSNTVKYLNKIINTYNNQKKVGVK